MILALPPVDWPALHRPLALPALTAGANCPVSRDAPEITGARYGVDGAIGSGPVFPMLGSSAVVAFVRRDSWGSQWAGQKVLWFVLPRYRGPVLVRGRSLDSGAQLRFDDQIAPELRIAPGETAHWRGQRAGSRGRPSYIRVTEPGCYAVQIDGTTFSKVVVFHVDVMR